MCGAPLRDRSQSLIVGTITTGVINLVAVILRTSVALYQKSLGLDDLFAAAAGVASIPLNVLIARTGYLGFGKDTWKVPTENIYDILRVGLKIKILIHALIMIVVRLCSPNFVL